MANFMDFSSDNVNIFIIILDKSGSMRDDRENVIEGLEMHKRSFEGFPEANSIAVSICHFDEDFYVDDFKHINNLSTDYHTDGYTALYYAIVRGKDHLQKYIREVKENKGIIPNATFIVFSDGQPEHDRMSRRAAMNAIEELNDAGITTVFVAFGAAIDSGFGDDLGFVSTTNVKERETLVTFLGVELSSSIKEQSKSMKSLGANFFSQAADKTQSENYSQTTTQALEDLRWIDEI